MSPDADKDLKAKTDRINERIVEVQYEAYPIDADWWKTHMTPQDAIGTEDEVVERFTRVYKVWVDQQQAIELPHGGAEKPGGFVIPKQLGQVPAPQNGANHLT